MFVVWDFVTFGFDFCQLASGRAPQDLVSHFWIELPKIRGQAERSHIRVERKKIGRERAKAPAVIRGSKTSTYVAFRFQ